MKLSLGVVHVVFLTFVICGQVSCGFWSRLFSCFSRNHQPPADYSVPQQPTNQGHQQPYSHAPTFPTPQHGHQYGRQQQHSQPASFSSPQTQYGHQYGQPSYHPDPIAKIEHVETLLSEQNARETAEFKEKEIQMAAERIAQLQKNDQRGREQEEAFRKARRADRFDWIKP